MKHSIEELIALAHTYFPKGMTPSDPGYAQTREVRNQREPRVPASAKYDTWRAMLARLDARFPRDRFPGVTLANHSLFLQVATASTSDRCFTGTFWLPPQSVEERDRELSFFVSFVVPYYVIRGMRMVLNGETTQQGKPAVDVDWSFAISPADEPLRQGHRRGDRGDLPRSPAHAARGGAHHRPRCRRRAWLVR